VKAAVQGQYLQVAEKRSQIAIKKSNLIAAVLRQPGVERILWLLDEVQELATSTEGDRAMMAVRAVANKHKADGKVLLLMTGSSKEGLPRLFAAHGKPSFGLAERQDFPVLGRECAARPDPTSSSFSKGCESAACRAAFVGLK